MIIPKTKTSFKGNVKSFLQFSYGTWILALISFLTTPVISWLILPEEFGKAAMFTIAYNLLINLVLMGADQSYSRVFFERTEPEGRARLIAEALGLPIVAGLLCSFLILATWNWLSFLLFGRLESYLLALLLGGSLIIGSINRISLLLIRMQKRAKAFSALQVFSGLANVAFLLVYSFLVSRDFTAIIAAFFFSTFFTTVFCVLLERRAWHLSTRFLTRGINWQIFRYGAPFVPVFLLDWLFQGTDRFFLRYYTSFEDVGLFVASFKIVSVINLIQTGFTLFWVPFSFEKFNKDPEDKSSYSLIFNYLSLILFSFVAVVLLFSEEIVLLLSKDYSGIADIFPFLLFVPVLFTLSEITVVGINFQKKTSLHLWVSTVALVINVILNFLLIPQLGVKGAALSTAIGYLGFFLVRTLLALKLYPVAYEWPKFMFALCVVFSSAALNTFTFSGYLTYSLSLLAFVVIILAYYLEIKSLSRLILTFTKSYCLASLGFLSYLNLL